jgi:adenosine kinase
MDYAHLTKITARNDVKLGIIAPDGRDAMLQHAEQFARSEIPFVFDPGQQLPRFDSQELRTFVDQATWVTVNDYEGKMLSDRTGWSCAEISRRVRGLIVTLGAEGSQVWVGGEQTLVPPCRALEIVDPTGCGDAYRGALLHGLEQGWSLSRCAALGNQMGALKIAQRGPQNYTVDLSLLSL